MVVLRVTGLDGKVLCGPEDVSLAESVHSTAFVIIHILRFRTESIHFWVLANSATKVSGRISDLKSRLITQSPLDSMTVCLLHDREALSRAKDISGFENGLGFNIGAELLINIISGIPYYKYGIMGPETLF